MSLIVAEAWGPEGFGVYSIRVEPEHWEFVSRASGAARHVACTGFVDVHIHGAFGNDFMSASPEAMLDLNHRLWELGYEAWLPTTVTASCADVLRALDVLPSLPMVRGFHLEGPFISKVFPGAQPPEWIVDDWPLAGMAWEWRRVLDDPRLRVITLAPENRGALDWIARLSRRGVIVSMGHTNATFDEAHAAVEAGATHSTHTFNAMRGLHHREAGMLGLALMDDRVNAELIYDRLHVSTAAARLLLRTKPLASLIAVSDSTKATGLSEGATLDMWGHPCVVGKGDVRLQSNGALAGSCITLADAFRNLLNDFGPEVAIAMCSRNPARILGVGLRRMLVFDRDGSMVATSMRAS